MLRLGVNCCLLEACAAPPHVRLSAKAALEYLSGLQRFLQSKRTDCDPIPPPTAATTPLAAAAASNPPPVLVSLPLWVSYEEWQGKSAFAPADLESLWIVFAAIALDSKIAVGAPPSEDPMEISISLPHFALLLLLQVRRSEARSQQQASRVMRAMETANAVSAAAAQCNAAAAAASAMLSPRRLASSAASPSPQSALRDDSSAIDSAEAFLSFVLCNLDNLLRACSLQFTGRLPAYLAPQALDILSLLFDPPVDPPLREAVAAAVSEDFPWGPTAALLQSVLRVDGKRQLAARRNQRRRRGSADVQWPSASPRGSLAAAASATSLEQALSQPVAASGGGGGGPSSLFLRSPFALVLDGVRRESVYIDRSRSIRVRQRRPSVQPQQQAQPPTAPERQQSTGDKQQKGNFLVPQGNDVILLEEGSEDVDDATVAASVAGTTTTTASTARSEGIGASAPAGAAGAATGASHVLQSVHLLDLQDCTIVLLRPVRYLIITSCLNCTITAVSVSCLASLQACKYVRLHAVARAVRFENCYGPQASLYCHAPPAVCGDTRAATLGPLGLIYADLPAAMRAAGLPLVERFVNRFALPTVSDAGSSTTHVPFAVRVKDAGKTTNSHTDAYQLLHPDKLEMITLPTGDSGGAHFSLPLPEIYHTAYLQKQQKAREVIEALEKRGQDFESGSAAYAKALQLHFMSWLIREGHIKELCDACRLEASMKP